MASKTILRCRGTCELFVPSKTNLLVHRARYLAKRAWLQALGTFHRSNAVGHLGVCMEKSYSESILCTVAVLPG